MILIVERHVIRSALFQFGVRRVQVKRRREIFLAARLMLQQQHFGSIDGILVVYDDLCRHVERSRAEHVFGDGVAERSARIVPFEVASADQIVPCFTLGIVVGRFLFGYIRSDFFLDRHGIDPSRIAFDASKVDRHGIYRIRFFGR